jgi:triacylglycerol lipase
VYQGFGFVVQGRATKMAHRRPANKGLGSARSQQERDRTRRGVVLIPGFMDTPGLFRRMGNALRAAGHDTDVFILSPSTGARGMDELAEDLERFVNERFPHRRLAIVGFSMGGIVARYWIQRLGGSARTDRLIALATPHHGTATARFLPLRGIRQLRRGSPFLEELNADRESLLACGVASIWSPVDLMVVPPGSGRLGIGVERPLLIPLHAWIPRSRRVIREVLRLLDG